uniref:Cysteine-knot AMPAR-modulating protein 52 transcript variant b n=1 Tax=Mus musculus TaxID=10090 RepID=A0A172Q410_MOUSE|nr:cysteine-knot AMPAR-modulating protein 52 transcript variant b [Mus musculus]
MGGWKFCFLVAYSFCQGSICWWWAEESSSLCSLFPSRSLGAQVEVVFPLYGPVNLSINEAWPLINCYAILFHPSGRLVAPTGHCAKTQELTKARKGGEQVDALSTHWLQMLTFLDHWMGCLVPWLLGDRQYNHPILSSATQTPTHEKPRMNNILTSATEPYDLSFSRSYQNLAHLPPSYESAVKTNPSKYSSLKRLTDKEADEYYMRRRHLPDLAARGTLPLNVIQMSQQKPLPRERPRRPIRAMSQDRVLSPRRGLPDEFGMPYDRILSDEQLLSTERLHSQDPLLSPERTAFPEQSLSRAISHTDVFVSTPVLDRYRMTKMHSHPSASNNSYATLGQSQTAAKRHAFASRRHNTVEQLHYIPGHHTCYTASKTEVTV